MLSSFRTKRLAGTVLVVVPLVFFVLGVGGLTWMRPSEFVTVTSPPTRSQVVFTGKNVLESTSESVTITARVPRDTEVFLGVALTSDVQAFVAASDHEVLADFSGKDGFVTHHVPGKKRNSANSEQTKSPAATAPHEVEQNPAQPAQADNPDLRKLDIWSQSATGKGSVSLKWTLSDSRWSAVAFVGNPTPEGNSTETTGQAAAKPDPAAKDDVKTGKNDKPDAKPGAQPAGPTLQLKWHREPSLAPAWFMTIVGALALLAVLAYIVLSFISEVRSKARRAAAEEKEKTIRLAAEAVGEVEASLHPRRRKLRYVEVESGVHEVPSDTGEISSLAPDSENWGDDMETAAGGALATHETSKPSRRERRQAKQAAVESDDGDPNPDAKETEQEAS